MATIASVADISIEEYSVENVAFEMADEILKTTF
jgi:hypothetical protein